MGDDNFTMDGFVLLDTKKKKEAAIDGLVFDYDNRPAMYVNHYESWNCCASGCAVTEWNRTQRIKGDDE